MNISLFFILTSKKEIIEFAAEFLKKLNPENYCDNVFGVDVRHLHGTIPTSSAIPFEIRYHAGNEKSSGNVTDNKNTVYYMKLYIKNCNGHRYFLAHQTKIVAPENEIVTVPMGVRQLIEARKGNNFLNYL